MDKVKHTPELIEELAAALSALVPIVQRDRDVLVECHTFPINDISTLDPDVKDEVAEADEALAAARAALSKVRQP